MAVTRSPFAATSLSSATKISLPLAARRAIGTLANFKVPEIKNEPNVCSLSYENIYFSTLTVRRNTTRKARPSGSSSPKQ